MKDNGNYMRGFIPYAVAAAVLSLCGGFTAALPSNISTEWNMANSVTFISLAYSIGAATLAPVMGKLGDAIGRRRMMLWAMALYTVGQILIAICPGGSLPLMLVFRFVAGAGAAGIAPVVISYIMTDFPQEKVGQGFSIYMFLSCCMVIFGPTIGGIVMAQSGWRSVMWICVALCVISFILVFIMVPKGQKTGQSLKGFDYVGAVFVLLFFASFMCMFTFGQNNGWMDQVTLGCIAVAVVTLIILILIERRAGSPIISGAFIARRQFVFPVVVLFLTQGLMSSCMTNIITFSLLTTGDRTLSGIATSVMYIGMALGTIIIGPMADKREPKYVAAVALVFVIAGAALQMFITASSGLLVMCAALFLVGLGLGGNTTIFMNVALSGCKPELATSGSGTYNVFRDMSSPFGVAIFVPMFSAAIDSATLSDPHALPEALQGAVQGCVKALHSTAIWQVVFVVVGFALCFFIPKVHAAAADQS